MLIRQLPYIELKDAYQTVKCFVEGQTHAKIYSLRGDIEEQLGIAGDDTEELLEKFIKTFGLSANGFAFDEHFYSEGEQFGSGPLLINFIVLIVKVFIGLIEILSFKPVKFACQPNWHRPSERKVSGLTFKQMLTWYLEKDFVKAENIVYQLTIHAN